VPEIWLLMGISGTIAGRSAGGFVRRFFWGRERGGELVQSRR
jgi:hypothetical protein